MTHKLDWRPCFPLAKPRQEQIEAIEFILSAFFDDKKDTCIAELGTGVGKSAIAITISNYMRAYEDKLVKLGLILPSPQTYILTSQKVLQDQYARDFFASARDLRSSSNFSCGWIANQTCAETMRLERALKNSQVSNYIGCSHACPYREAKQIFLDSPTGITNYSYFLSETVYAGALGTRELIVFDESHHIEDEMRKWGTSTISRGTAQKSLKVQFPDKNASDDTIREWIEQEYAPAARELLLHTVGSIKNKISRKQHILKPELIHELAHRYEWLDKHVCQLNRYLESNEQQKKNYLIVRECDTDDDRVSLKPLDVTPYVRDLLFAKGRKRLLMSATVLDEQTFCRNNGISLSHSNHAFLSIPTTFDSSSFGIVFDSVGKMSKKHVGTTSSAMVKKIKQILAKHPNDKGIIHTTSYAISEILRDVKNDRLIFQSRGEAAADIIARHIADPRPTIIVAPAMIEGIDLYDDLGRLQIICKVPYPYLGDLVIATKMSIDPRWYAWRTVMSIVQAVGRCIRSKDDWAHTYILDECFSDLFMKWTEMFPAHFQKMQVVS